MGAAESRLAKDLAKALLELFPFGSVGTKLLAAPIDYAFERYDAKKGRKSIAAIAAAVAAGIRILPDPRNPGSAASASSDVVTILRESRLSPDLLIQLNLDAELVLEHLMSSGQEIMKNASAQRRRFIVDGLKTIADGVVEVAPELPGVQLAFMRAMLKSREAGRSDA